MERKGLGGEDEICNEPNERETDPLLARPPEPPVAYEKFLAGRERQKPKRWIIPAQFALKVSFWSLGMWGHRVWKYFAQTFLVIAAIIFFVFSVILIARSRDRPSQFCPPDSNFTLWCYHYTAAVLFAATIPLCLAFIACHIVGKSSTSALVCPPQFLIEETHKAVIFMSFLAFLAMNAVFSVKVSYTVSVLNFTAGPNASSSHNDSLPWSAKVFMVVLSAESLFSWLLLNICHVFAAICIVLGRLTCPTGLSSLTPQYWFPWRKSAQLIKDLPTYCRGITLRCNSFPWAGEGNNTRHTSC